jgi:c-di-GMP-binding flagellar brake protein YcgR
MIIAMPMEKGYPVFLARGKTFYGKVFSNNGIYTFQSTYADKKMNPLPIWIVTTPINIEKSQQRSFVRFDVALPVLVEYVLNNTDNEVTSFKLITKDLSGGGLQVISNKRIKVGKSVQVTLDIPGYGVFQMDGQVVRVDQPQEERQLFWVSIKFLNIPNSMRDKIIRFIVRRQLEQRQKLL